MEGGMLKRVKLIPLNDSPTLPCMYGVVRSVHGASLQGGLR